VLFEVVNGRFDQNDKDPAADGEPARLAPGLGICEDAAALRGRRRTSALLVKGIHGISDGPDCEAPVESRHAGSVPLTRFAA